MDARMSDRTRRGPAGGQRGRQSRVASSGARANAQPYSASGRPAASRMASGASWDQADASRGPAAKWPPTQIAIRGVSGPTWVTVANLILGTSPEDIEATLRQFGDIAEVKLRKAPSANHPSVAYEVGFMLRSSALKAIDQLDGALADGRILKVFLTDEVPLIPAAAATQTARQASPPREPLAARGAAAASAAQTTANANKELLDGGAGRKQRKTTVAAAAVVPSGVAGVRPGAAAVRTAAGKIVPAGSAPNAPSLSQRLLTPQEAAKLKRNKEKAAAATAAQKAGGSGAEKGKSLASRIQIPLAERLSSGAGPKSDLSSAKGTSARAKAKAKLAGATAAAGVPSSTKKPRNKRGKGKAAGAGGMDIDG